MSGLDLMRRRLNFDGGEKPTPDGLIVTAMYRSFLSALHNSYQAEDVIFKNKVCRVLITRDKLTNDYDQKILGADFKDGFQAGDTFYWPRTNSHWITYLQQYEQEAFYQGRIRRCDYSIEVNGKKYWVYLRGPVETALVWRQKHQIEFNELNYSIILYVTKNDETDDFFQRLNILDFDGHKWRIDTVDRYSTPGILEVNLGEYYDRTFEDVEENKVAVVTTEPHIVLPEIDIYPFDTDIEFRVNPASKNGQFYIPSADSSKAKITEKTNDKCIVDILSSKSDIFQLCYRPSNSEEPIIAEVTIKSL